LVYAIALSSRHIFGIFDLNGVTGCIHGTGYLLQRFGLAG
jgi:hypothetical protein